MKRERICDYSDTEGLFAQICIEQDEIDFRGQFDSFWLDPFCSFRAIQISKFSRKKADKIIFHGDTTIVTIYIDRDFKKDFDETIISFVVSHIDDIPEMVSVYVHTGEIACWMVGYAKSY